ncbi:hypothetical protein HAX54_045750 [Datura stramonium]|uniref:Uncharacterized protein n=1 Tax=Datura stramonium TaxID=4076 RepID=A0ABS8SQR7_DATST|nr:hypothetical protein [Datura stramonium]
MRVERAVEDCVAIGSLDGADQVVSVMGEEEEDEVAGRWPEFSRNSKRRGQRERGGSLSGCGVGERVLARMKFFGFGGFGEESFVLFLAVILQPEPSGMLRVSA